MGADQFWQTPAAYADWVALQADKVEMPAVAKELLEIYTGFLRFVTFGNAARFLDGPDKPVTGTGPQAIRIEMWGAIYVALLLILFDWQSYSQWQAETQLALTYPYITPQFPYQVIIYTLGFLFGLPIVWQSLIGNQRVVRELPTSDLFERLIDGDALFEAIYDKTPFPWNWICLGGPPRSLRGRAMLLVNYLDWFLGPRLMHFRWYWLQTALLLFGLPAVAVLGASFAAHTPRAHFPLLLVVMYSLQPIVMLVTWITGQKAVNAAALIKELRRRYGAAPAAEAV